MADVAIARYDANTGWLPPVCPKHGRPADRAIQRKFSTPTPGWVFALLLISWIVVLIAAAVNQKSDTLAMPGCFECSNAARTRLWIRCGTGLAALLAIVAAVVTGSGGLIALSILLGLIWLLALSSLVESIGQVTGKLDGPWLRLKGVHPAFVAALRPNPAWQQVHYQPQPPVAVYHVGGVQPGAPAPYYQPPYSG
jgi:hypothetical protein